MKNVIDAVNKLAIDINQLTRDASWLVQTVRQNMDQFSSSPRGQEFQGSYEQAPLQFQGKREEYPTGPVPTIDRGGSSRHVDRETAQYTAQLTAQLVSQSLRNSGSGTTDPSVSS